MIEYVIDVPNKDAVYTAKIVEDRPSGLIRFSHKGVLSRIQIFDETGTCVYDEETHDYIMLPYGDEIRLRVLEGGIASGYKCKKVSIKFQEDI